jgi:hypothetical protein
MFYIPVGMYFSKEKLPNRVSWIMMIGGYVANVIVDSNSISSVLIAVSAIAFFDVVKGINLSDSHYYQMFRKMSTVIYFIHMYAWSIYYKLYERHYGLMLAVTAVFAF